MSNPFLSIIIPAYNEENRLPNTLEQILTFLDGQPYPGEVLVVENGSQDRTLEIARSFTAHYPQLQVFQLDERGKGRAVRFGMLQAKGDYLFMCDADLSMPVAQINQFIPPALAELDVAIGSREKQGAVRYNEPSYRHVIGRVFNTMIRTLALPGLNDTQCGFKCFRAPVARHLFQEQTLSGWSFDVEILFIARLHGYQIVEVPIHWYFNPDSKVRVVEDSARMAMDLVRIRMNATRGVYNHEK